MKVNTANKLILILGIVLVLVISAMLLGCSSSTPSTTQAPATTSSAPKTTAAAPTTSAAPSTTQAAAPASSAAATFTLRMAPGGSNPPPAEGYTLADTSLADIIQKVTNGRVKVQIYWAQTLVPQNSITLGMQGGTVDLAQLAPHQETGRIPLSMVGQLPGLGKDLWTRNSAYYELCTQDPLKSELAKYNMKAISAMGMNDQFLISAKPIRTLADLKGKKIGASGIGAQVHTALGSVPVNLPPTDQYTGLQKGTLDGIAAPLAAINDFKFYEVGKYFTYLPAGPRVVPVVINMDTWNKFSADIQKAITDALPDFITTSADAFDKVTDAHGLKAMQDAKVEIINLSAADMAEVQKVLDAQADQWAAQQGDNGKKVLNDYRALIAKYEPLDPNLKK